MNPVSEKPVRIPAARKWILPPAVPEEELSGLRSLPGLHPDLPPILYRRGIRTGEDLRHFFNPSLSDLADPFQMKDMDVAAERLLKSLGNGEKLMVYGDYDVDGTTATALVYQVLTGLGFDATFYIPDRKTEGYGVSEAGVREAARRGVRLLVTLDCGIKAHDKVELARELGIDCIICDHHLPADTLPAAVAILDPRRSDCSYPCRDLSGCGVGFTLMRGLFARLGLDTEPLFRRLDLVAVSIAADIVPVTGENRILMHHGLLQINRNPSPGLLALMIKSGFKPDAEGRFSLKADRLVFGLAPRINAAGRIAHGENAVRLLVSEREEEAMERAGEVDDQNFTRKELDKTTTRQALEQIAGLEARGFRYSSVVYQADWHKGVIGIVASRCIEQVYRPTIILTGAEGKLTGSGRSIPGFDLHAALEDCSGHLIQFGGHAFAAGLTLLPENLEDFARAFEARVMQELKPEDLQPRLELDGELRAARITDALLQQIRRMEPFGPGNLSPLFLLRGVRNSGMSRLLESKSGGAGHLKLSLSHPEMVSQGRPYVLEGIAFGMADWWEALASGKALDIAFHVEENDFRDRKSLQLAVKDIRLSEEETD